MMDIDLKPLTGEEKREFNFILTQAAITTSAVSICSFLRNVPIDQITLIATAIFCTTAIFSGLASEFSKRGNFYNKKIYIPFQITIINIFFTAIAYTLLNLKY